MLYNFTLNSKLSELTIDPDLTLLWVLRDQFGLTGPSGRGIGMACGARIYQMPMTPERILEVIKGQP
ncbi:MAG: hypothetical protein GY790_04355 [Bacteroidetes bacterium]|nr:hypothetical protein [Bacteroidota bacterium]